MITVIGAGPVGTLLALLLAKRGQRVRLFERRPDPRTAPEERGRSINLALAARGIRALERAGAYAEIAPELIVMRGRELHELGGLNRFLAYGQKESEVIYAMSRTRLNRLLVEIASRQPLIEMRFAQRCLGFQKGSAQKPALSKGAAPPNGSASQSEQRLLFRDEDSGAVYTQAAELVIGADGAGSALRGALQEADELQFTEDWLDHDYKELVIPARRKKSERLAPNALHIWPRGGHMLIALPNTDGSFTATLFLPRHGAESFDSLRRPADARAFFTEQFPDALVLMRDFDRQFPEHPQSRLATVHCFPWHAGNTLLIGDAAHAIVPFHGQGLNCGFEDCVLLDELLARNGDGKAAFREYEQIRRPHTDAIARMALENYQEMRDTVRDPDFARRKLLANELERDFPGRFIPRYSMVMFHPEIPYAEAQRRGAVQERIMDALLQHSPTGPLSVGLAAQLMSEAGL